MNNDKATEKSKQYNLSLRRKQEHKEMKNPESCIFKNTDIPKTHRF